jgi:uroporphyrinogen-III synthase
MKRIVVTRAAHQAEPFADQLRAAGSAPVLYPCIAIAPPDDTGPLDDALGSLTDYDWLVVTSSNTVHVLAQRMTEVDWGSVKFAAVGDTTAVALLDVLGASAAFIPAEQDAAALADGLPLETGARVLLPQSARAGDELAIRLRERGATIHTVNAYTTVCGDGGDDVPGMLAAGQIDALTFMSGSAVRCFVERIAPATAFDIPAFCIGASTAQVAIDTGFDSVQTAAAPSTASMIDALLAYFRTKT